MKDYLKEILSSEGLASVKRLVTLLVSVHFILSAFIIIFLVCYMVFFIPKGKVDPTVVDLLKDILKDDMIIIMSGLGFIAVDNVGQAFVEVSKHKHPPNPFDNFNPPQIGE